MKYINLRIDPIKDQGKRFKDIVDEQLDKNALSKDYRYMWKASKIIHFPRLVLKDKIIRVYINYLDPNLPYVFCSSGSGWTKTFEF